MSDFRGVAQFGDFLAGTAASLAFLWLVFGFYQQGLELKQNNETLKLQTAELKQSNETFKLQTEELALQREELAKQREETARLAEQAERQTQIISDNELHARRDTFMRLADLMVGEMNSSLSRFLKTIGQSNRELHDSLWTQVSAGGVTAFGDYLVSMKSNDGNFENYLTQFLDRHETQRKYAEDFLLRLDYLISEADNVDPSLAISKAFSEGGFGEVKPIMERFLELTGG